MYSKPLRNILANKSSFLTAMTHSTWIIDGRKISQELKQNSFIPRIKSLESRGIVPGLAIVQIGSHQDSNVYIRMKLKLAKELGIRYEHIQLEDSHTESGLIEAINDLNNRREIHGILVQLPLPSSFNVTRIMNSISPTKDVDGFHSINVGELTKRQGDPYFVPCTAKGVLYLIQKALLHLNNSDSLQGKTAVIVGRSDIVGTPTAHLLLKHSATVIICHSKTVNLKEMISLADILVVAIGHEKFIKGEWIRPGAIVIDVGINATSDFTIVGDIDYDSMIGKAGAATPVPGGVGPLTVAMLMENTISSAESNK